MRLCKIKLAGFKSFVDPTTIEVPGDLIGIVGPNGCGKSNIIDAVRWVMGEISAKHLRGESMADVVFSGSGSRKPTGQASVELVFDNSDGRIGGQYASYSEISIKRLVTRDAAQSHYYLNGARCRRRDVTDVFLGTGLGPRSYAIIEQGMISRLIEAKPEELREFLEEAAGISKYKERRRETQNRISHAKENLDRLDDLREELDKRLEHLQRQAAMAEKYKSLKSDERILNSQLLALKWQSFDNQVKTEAQSTSQQERVVEVVVGQQRRLDARIDEIRNEHVEKSQLYNKAYREVLDAGADTARLEETIQNLRARQSELEETLERERTAHGDAQRHLDEEKIELSNLESALALEQPELVRLKQVESSANAEFGRFEEAMQSLQSGWDLLNERVSSASQIMHTQGARTSGLDDQIRQLEHQKERLLAEQDQQVSDELRSEVERIAAECERDKRGLSLIEEQLVNAEIQVEKLRSCIRKNALILNSNRESYQKCLGQISSIKRLQADTLGTKSGAAEKWLRSQGLNSAPQLADIIDVLPGWEQAVEMVLRFHLESVCIDGTPDFWSTVVTQSEGEVSLVDLGVKHVQYRPSVDHEAVPLKNKVKTPSAIGILLEGVYTISSLDEGIKYRGRLGPRESLVTPEGIWLGRNWLRSPNMLTSDVGILVRKQELKQLQEKAFVLRKEVDAAAKTEENDLQAVMRVENEISLRRKELSARNKRLVESQSLLAVNELELKKSSERLVVIDSELKELNRVIDQCNEDQAVAMKKYNLACEDVSVFTAEREGYADELGEKRAELDRAQKRWKEVRDNVYDVGVRAESMRSKLGALNAAAQRNNDYADKLEGRCRELADAIEATVEPLHAAKQSMKSKLAHRRILEADLQKVRLTVEEVERTLREVEQSRGSLDKKVSTERQRLNDLKIKDRETVVRRSTIEEQIGSSHETLNELLAKMPQEADVSSWENKLEGLQRRVNRLGPINLAAIEEYEQQAERKTYLDEQHVDLVEALETLEQAIRKIDRETRSRFKETYERVNQGLSELFPRLFGGGSAFLQMTGQDLLDTGISMVAQPPGKRNTSIHVLSGGEKALSAVALVFSIFELNPAPFCLLDEVDAPLDDANVGRFCDLVRSMNDRVQFMVVTHNKTTMEMTQQLLGVTMNEPGISRMVAVDVEEAVQLAAV